MKRGELAAGIERWKRTGYGIDPNQRAFRHYENSDCDCMGCRPGLLPVVETDEWARIEHYPRDPVDVESWLAVSGGAGNPE